MHIFQILIYLMDSKKLKCINDSEESQDHEEIQELQDEMIDRFGEYPEELMYLFKMLKLKCYALSVRD